MRLDSAGNLGLGVTPSAWADSRGFQIANTAASPIIGGLFASESNGQGLVSNAYYDGTNWKFIYVASFEAARYELNSGKHIWYNSAAGTSGNNVTFTQAMTLDASGNLGVGATSPAVRLDVQTASAVGGITLTATTGTNGSALACVNTGGTSYFGRNNSTGGAFGGTAYATVVYSGGAYPMAFYTNDTERAQITSGGAFLVNTSTVGGKFYVLNPATDFQTNTIKAHDSNASTTSDGVLSVVAERNTTNNTFYALGYYNNGAAAFKWRVADSGNVTNTNGTYGTISDAKHKADIVDAGSQWDDLKAVRFRKFKMKDDPQGIVQLGVVAQELEQVSPGLIEEHPDTEQVEVPVLDEDGNETGQVTTEMRPTGTTTKSVKTSILLMKAAVALQEAMARIEALEARLEALEA
jgi:hypothetical protein